MEDCISFWWETGWILNFSLSWHVGKNLAVPATPSYCFCGLKEVWKAWHTLSLLQSRTRTEDHCPGSTTKVLLQSCSSYSLYSWLFQYTRLFHAAASLPCPIIVSYQPVEVVDPGTDIRRWKPTWEPGSEKQRRLILPCSWNTATSFQKLDSVVSRTFFDSKLI